MLAIFFNQEFPYYNISNTYETPFLRNELDILRAISVNRSKYFYGYYYYLKKICFINYVFQETSLTKPLLLVLLVLQGVSCLPDPGYRSKLSKFKNIYTIIY